MKEYVEEFTNWLVRMLELWWAIVFFVFTPLILLLDGGPCVERWVYAACGVVLTLSYYLKFIANGEADQFVRRVFIAAGIPFMIALNSQECARRYRGAA